MLGRFKVSTLWDTSEFSKDNYIDDLVNGRLHQDYYGGTPCYYDYWSSSDELAPVGTIRICWRQLLGRPMGQYRD